MGGTVEDEATLVNNINWQIEELFIKSLTACLEKDSDNEELSLMFVRTHHRQICDALRDAMKCVKFSLQPLTICSNCKKIKTENGEWSRLEKYFYEQLNIEFSHGYCEQCAEGILRDCKVKPATFPK